MNGSVLMVTVQDMVKSCVSHLTLSSTGKGLRLQVHTRCKDNGTTNFHHSKLKAVLVTYTSKDSKTITTFKRDIPSWQQATTWVSFGKSLELTTSSKTPYSCLDLVPCSASQFGTPDDLFLQASTNVSNDSGSLNRRYKIQRLNKSLDSI